MDEKSKYLHDKHERNEEKLHNAVLMTDMDRVFKEGKWKFKERHYQEYKEELEVLCFQRYCHNVQHFMISETNCIRLSTQLSLIAYEKLMRRRI
jgi:hypothetical protein